MRVSFLIVGACLLGQIATAQTNAVPQTNLVAKLDAQYGFRDVKFEQSIETLKGMALLEDDGDSKYYARKSDVLEQGGAKLKSIEYGFYKGKLAMINIVTQPGENGATLLKTLEGEYGPGAKSPRTPNKCYWFGQRVTMDYFVDGHGKANLDLWSVPLFNAKQADSKAKH